MQIFVTSLSYAAHASFSEAGVSLLILMLILARTESLAYIPQASFSQKFPLRT